MPRTPTSARGFVRVPGTFSWVRWPPRRDGLIRIRLALPIQCAPPLPRWVLATLELGVPRPALQRGLGEAPDLARWMTGWQADILATLAEAALGRRQPRVRGTLRRRQIVLSATFDRVPYHVRISRSALDGLVHVLVDPTGSRSLRLELGFVLLPLWKVDRPRGRAAAAVFMPVVRAAYRFSRDLCARAWTRPALRQQVNAVLGCSDRDWSLQGARTTLALRLVERSLEGVWDRLTRPSARDSAETHRELMRGPAVPPELHAQVQPLWDARLLGEKGQAARDFDVV